jgi:DNA polymerase-4
VSRAVLFAEVPCFYALVERAQDPALAERPVIVGGDPRKRGLVQSASPEALAAGVEIDMPMLEALRLCPQARALRTDMAVYRDVSRRLFACLRRAFPRLEPLGLGAAWLDVGTAGEPPEAIAARLVAAVAAEVSLPLRVGIASGKFLARLAAHEAGESGVRRILPGRETEFLHPLPVQRLEGVGRKTAAALAELGAHTIGDVAALAPDRLEQALGAHGLRILALATAREDTPVRASRHAQSLSREVTLGDEGGDRSVAEEHLLDLARRLETELARQGLSAGRVGLKVRYADQGIHTRTQSLASAVFAAVDIHAAALRLLERTQVGSRPVRRLGLQLGGLAPRVETDRQLDLFPPGR